MWKRIAAAFAAFSAVVMLTGLALLPPAWRAHADTHGRLHPWVHLIVFAGIAWMTTRAARSRPALPILLVSALGCAMEYTESHLSGSALEYGDMVLDTVGAVLGAFVAWMLQRRAHAMREGTWE